MIWPTAADYSAAIQNPQVCFRDPDLRGGHVRLHPVLGPESYSGNFAVVFPLHRPSGRSSAVRCFLHPGEDRRERYQAISEQLRESRLPLGKVHEVLPNGLVLTGRQRDQALLANQGKSGESDGGIS